MKRTMVGLFLTGLLVVLIPAFGQKENPWVGTWKFVSGYRTADPAPQVTMTFKANGMEFVRINAMGSPRDSREVWTAQFDGRDYPVSFTGYSTQPSYNHVSAVRLDKGSVEISFKNADKVTLAQRWTVARDGKEMTVAAKSQDSSEWAVASVWDRAGGKPDPASPLAGAWNRNFTKGYSRNPPLPIVIEPAGQNGIRWSQGNATFSADIDGKDNPVKIYWWQTAALRRVDARTLEVVGKGAGTATETWRMIVSGDGGTMTMTSDSVQPSGTRSRFEWKSRKQ